MATISGTWVFNSVLSKPNFDFFQSGMDFYIDGLDEPVAAIIYYLETYGAYTGNRLWYRGGGGGFADGDRYMVYNFDTNTWTDTKYRAISFSGDEGLDEEFVAWFTSNATQQTEEEQPTTPTKKLTRLCVGSAVASSGGKCFKKLSATIDSNFTLKDGSVLVTSDGLTFKAKEN